MASYEGYGGVVGFNLSAWNVGKKKTCRGVRRIVRIIIFPDEISLGGGGEGEVCGWDAGRYFRKG